MQIYRNNENFIKIDDIDNFIKDLFINAIEYGNVLNLQNIYVFKKKDLDNKYIIKHNFKNISNISNITTLSEFKLMIKNCHINNLYKSEFYIMKPSLIPIIYILTYPNINYIKQLISIKKTDNSLLTIKQIINLKKYTNNIFFVLFNYLKKINLQILFDNITETMLINEFDKISKLEKSLLINFKMSSSKLPHEIIKTIYNNFS